MLTPVYHGTFKKERKLMQKRGKDINKLTEVMALLIDEQPLPPHNSDHPLYGKWKTSRGCHIQGDWVLIYEIDEAARTVTFHRTPAAHTPA